jgi:hypothetical protein
MPRELLPRRVDEFLAQSGLRVLPGAVAVLRSCEGLLPLAEELGVARRAADAVALGVCNEAMFPTARQGQCWAAELAALSPASFGRVVTALRCRSAGPELVAAAAAAYAEAALAEVLHDPSGGKDHSGLVESVVDVLPSAADAPLPAAFLCRLLHAAVNSHASAKTCRDLELRVAAVLDQATAEDLLGVALDGAGERVANTDTIRRIVTALVERRQQQQQQESRSRRASLSGARADLVCSTSTTSNALQKVARTVDELAAELATEEALPVSKFVGLAGAVPREGSHDWVYRAVDIYLKTHPGLDEVQREKVCSVMDPLRLSYQARLHASQNKRLPLHAVLTALYYDNLNIRSGVVDDGSSESEAGKARAQATAEAELVRENEALRSELARRRAYLSGTQHNSSKGSASSSPVKKKATRFLGSVTRTLSRLNPFKGGWAKDTSSIADHGNTIPDHHVTKPKKRRFSIG